MLVSIPATRISPFPLALIIVLVIMAPLRLEAQTRGTVTSQSKPADLVKSAQLVEWAEEPNNLFWAAVYNEKYGRLSEWVDSIRGIPPYHNSISADWNLDVREVLDEHASEVMSSYAASGLLIDDPFIEDVVFRAISNVFPGDLPPGRTGTIRAYVADDPSPNAFALSDGTIVLNTGLLTALRSNLELEAVIAHEIAHVVLDHSVAQRIWERNQAQMLEDRARRRANRAAFLGALAAGVAGSLGGLNAAEAATVAAYTGAVASGVTSAHQRNQAAQLLLESGALYNRAQETEADRVAVEWLRRRGYPEDGLAIALNRLDELRKETRSSAEAKVYATHPPLSSRLVYAYSENLLWSHGATPYVSNLDPQNPEVAADRMAESIEDFYDSQFSPLLFLTARRLADDYSDYAAAESFLLRLMENGTPNASAYALMSRVLRFKGGEENLNRADRFLNTAFEIAYEPTWDLLIERAVLSTRLADYRGAMGALEQLYALTDEQHPIDQRWITRYWERLSHHLPGG